jgi:hypothetical protein
MAFHINKLLRLYIILMLVTLNFASPVKRVRMRGTCLHISCPTAELYYRSYSVLRYDSETTIEIYVYMTN